MADRELKKALGEKKTKTNKKKHRPLPLVLKFPFSKYLQQTYCAFLIMQSKKRALYLWISGEKKKKIGIYILKMYTRSLSTQTGTDTKRQKGGRMSLFTAHHKHTLKRRAEQARHSKYAEWICEMRSYLHIHLYSDRSKTRATICLRVKGFFDLLFCGYLIVLLVNEEFPHRN